MIIATSSSWNYDLKLFFDIYEKLGHILVNKAFVYWVTNGLYVTPSLFESLKVFGVINIFFFHFLTN